MILQAARLDSRGLLVGSIRSQGTSRSPSGGDEGGGDGDGGGEGGAGDGSSKRLQSISTRDSNLKDVVRWPWLARMRQLSSSATMGQPGMHTSKKNWLNELKSLHLLSEKSSTLF